MGAASVAAQPWKWSLNAPPTVEPLHMALGWLHSTGMASPIFAFTDTCKVLRRRARPEICFLSSLHLLLVLVHKES